MSLTAARSVCRIERAAGRVERDQLDIQIGQIRGQNLPVVGMYAAGNQHAARAAGDAHGHEHGLGRGAAAVVEARIRIVHAGQLG